MRNLKRVLSLVLAAMMLIGMMVIGASAADVDKGDVSAEYSTAIDVAVALGVITGDNNGVVNPTQTLKRSEAAVMITRLMVGPEAAYAIAEKYAAMPNSYTDSDGWSDGYINYCLENGYLAGRGNGIVDPNGPLKVEEFGIMLLRVLGYDDAAEGFAGANWDRAVAVKMINLGLDLDGVTFGTNLTRQQASQMILQALKSDMVYYDGNTKVTATDGTVVEIKSGCKVVAQKAEDNTMGIDGQQLGETLGVSMKAGTDEFGRPGASVWTINDETIYDTTDVPAAKYSTTEPVKAADLAKALGLKVDDLKGTDTKEYYVDGVDTEDVKLNAIAGGYGVQVEAYKNGDDITVVVINTYVVKVDAKEKTNSNPGYIDKDKGVLLEEGLYATGSYKDGDFILYTRGSYDGTKKDIVVSEQKAEFVKGTVTAIDSAETPAYAYIDGTKYFYAEEKDDSVDGFTPGDGANTAATSGAFYVDTYGNIVAYTANPPAADKELSYYYVLTFQSTTGTQGTNNMLNGTGAEAKAQVLDPVTGKVSIIDIAVVKGDDGWYYADADGEASEKAVETTDTTENGKDKTYTGHYVSYEKTDLGYVITPVSTETVESKTPTEFAIKKGAAEITVVNGTTKLANNSTTLVVITAAKKGPNTTYTAATYTGYKNFPEVKAGDATAAMVLTTGEGDKQVATTIYAIVKEAAESNTTSYAIYTGKGDTTKDGTPYNFIVDGKEASYFLGGNLAKASDDAIVGEVSEAGANGTEIKAGSVYTLAITNGKLTTVTAVDAKGTVEGVNRIEDGYVGTTEKVYYVGDGCLVYEAIGGNVKAAEVAAGDNISVYAKDAKKDAGTDNPIVLIVITDHAKK